MSIQQAIDEMKNGNISEIKRSISSKTPILIMNSLFFGVKNNLIEEDYIDKVKQLCSDDTTLMGFRIGSIAEAALSVLTCKKYTGNDLVTKSLIENNFNI